MTKTVLIGGARTPIGKFNGSLASMTATDLGAHAIRFALERTGVAPKHVDLVLMGNVVQAGVGPNPARQAAATAGIPMTTPAVTLNDLCLSGLQAVIDADRMIRAGEANVVIAGGMESMSNAPYLLPNARSGLRFGASQVVDALERDALVCAFDGIPMGAAAERYLSGYDIDRPAQDAFAAQSHARAAAATARGRLAKEIAPITTGGRTARTITDDEGIRPGTTIADLSHLRPAFSPDGSITAGSASQLSDGAAALVLMSRSRAEKLGVPWIAEIGGSALVSGPDPSLLLQPANAIIEALKRDGGAVEATDLDVVEINEAFAAVALASVASLGIRGEVVNPVGGAIALGHPVGMSGARLTLSLAYSLLDIGGGVGAAALCGGGGQGNALILRAF